MLKPYQEYIDQLFGYTQSDKSFIELYEIGDTPDIPVFTGRLDYINRFPGYYTRMEPKEYAAGIQVQRKLIDDKQYSVLNDLQDGLLKAYARTREKSAVRAFGYAFSTSWDFMTNEEGVSWCSGSHTTKSGVSTTLGFSNAGTSALSKTSISATRILFRKFRTDIGELYDSEPDTLLVPETQYEPACEAVGYDPRTGASSEKDPESANHKINSLYKSFKVVPWRRLDEYSTKSWFMIDSAMLKRMLRWCDRIKAETSTKIDWDTFAIQHKLYGRFGWGWSNWRCLYGHNVA
jgi:hypothetical protein